MKHSWKWNSSSSTLFIEFHWYIPLLLSPTGKIAVSFAKPSSSSYKQTFTRFSRGKSPSLVLTLQYLNYTAGPLSDCPNVWRFFLPWTLQIPLQTTVSSRFPSDSNGWTFLVCIFVFIRLSFSSTTFLFPALPLIDGLSSSMPRYFDRSPEPTCNQSTSIIYWKGVTKPSIRF